MSDKKRFEGWEDVACEDCQHYWDSSCDGSTGSQRVCTTFLAAKRHFIPERLERLEKRINALLRSTILIGLAMIIHLISHLVNS